MPLERIECLESCTGRKFAARPDPARFPLGRVLIRFKYALVTSLVRSTYLPIGRERSHDVILTSQVYTRGEFPNWYELVRNVSSADELPKMSARHVHSLARWWRAVRAGSKFFFSMFSGVLSGG